MIQRATLLLLALALTLAAPIFAASISVQSFTDSLTWNSEMDFSRADLKVVGPDGFVFHQTFEADETPAFATSNWAELPAGSYSWTLTLVSSHSPELTTALRAARETGNPQAAEVLKAENGFRSSTQSGSFTYDGLRLIVPQPAGETGSSHDLPTKDHIVNDDLITVGSQCVGTDCTAGEAFGFDTLRLKENNLRIKAEDTSSTSGFPTVDWQLTFNDSANGGLNRFSVESLDNSSAPFTVEYGAVTDSLYVDSNSHVGIGTSSPIANLHVVEGNTPMLRLEQDLSGGFSSQSWDVAGNESSFFIRDAAANTLPLRIRPSAPTSSIDIAGDGDVGIGTSSPEADLHVNGGLKVSGSDGTTSVLVEDTQATVAQRVLMSLKNFGVPTLSLENASTFEKWNISVKTNELELSKGGTGAAELLIDGNGNLTVLGTVSANNGADVFPDYVFEEGYDLMPLDQLALFIEANGHLPKIPSAQQVEEAGGINMTKMQYRLLEKIEELTLYTLSLHGQNRAQAERAEEQAALIEDLRRRLDAY